MSTAAADRARYLAAKQRVQALRAFYIHAAVFAVVMICLFGLNLYTGGALWAVWPLLGWGAGLAAHAAGIFGRTPKALKDWEERKVRELVERG